ncbi:MAG: fasciclin domain-containing protein [Bacteroidota bacterium]
MTKRFFAVLRYSVVAAVMAGFLVFSGCSDDDNGPTTFTGTIWDYINQDQFKQATSGNADTALDSLIMYLNYPAYADLKANLTGTTDFTLFAPSNTAFKNLTALPGLADPDQVNPDIIKGVLAYHMVQGKKTSADLTAGASLSTIYKAPGASANDVITVNSDGSLLTGSSNKSIQITTKDQLTTNGVVHTTATVLIPNATGSQLSAILGSLAASVLLGKDFTYMAYLIGYADTGVGAADQFTTKLATGSNLTLLAIPNPVFQAMAGSTTDAQVKTAITTAFSSPAIARAVLNNHLLTTKYTVAGSTGTTKFGATSTISAISGKVISVTTGVPAGTCQCTTGVVLGAEKTGGGSSTAPIVKADISAQAGIANGVLQVVGGIILP